MRGPFEQLAERYFEALYQCDVASLRALFHPHAVYAGNPAGEVTVLSRDAYLARVAEREPPALRGEPRDEQVVRVEPLGAHAALLHLACAFHGQRYRDVLGLVQVAGRWTIAAKLFDAQPRR